MSISIDSVSLDINGANIIKDISFTINPGELITILGPNGSGKSTLLRVISGDLLSTKGEVAMDNVPLSDMSFKTQALKEVSCLNLNRYYMTIQSRRLLKWVGLIMQIT